MHGMKTANQYLKDADIIRRNILKTVLYNWFQQVWNEGRFVAANTIDSYHPFRRCTFEMTGRFSADSLALQHHDGADPQADRGSSQEIRQLLTSRPESLGAPPVLGGLIRPGSARGWNQEATSYGDQNDNRGIEYSHGDAPLQLLLSNRGVNREA